MVKVCPLHNYKSENKEENMNNYFEKYPYDLHIFQKWALEGIVRGDHVLVTAPTGSGKTLPGEFAVDYFTNLGKKVIYTTPIKALSNQKYYDFTNKYPNIKIGLITGDIKTNPDADVLIMTTEILLNKLYITRSSLKDNERMNSFEMDIENELACVVYDEIHMINDEARGNVWEQSLLLLPKSIQIIGLSATLDNPERFAYWLETKGNPEVYDNNNKTVYLVSKKDRSVPLTHYTFITSNSQIFKLIKDKTIQEEIKNNTNKPFVLVDSKNKFNEEQYFKVQKYLKMFNTNKVTIRRQHVINQVCKYLLEHDMLPALCYVFSRKQLEICAKELTVNLLEPESKLPNIVENECNKIINKLPNTNEYANLKEYVMLVSLLKKGIGIHHAGMLPILREIVELLYSKGYIKVLFCTETIAVGLNLPVKTVIFTDVNKHDGNQLRPLYSHEYTQAAGRAGRLGLDTVGNVIHLNNIFRDMTKLEYKTMLNGKPQSLVSKFKISYNLLLSLISIGDNNFIEFSRKSMIQGEIDNQLNQVLSEMNSLQIQIEKTSEFIALTNIDENTAKDYYNLKEQVNRLTNRKKKDALKKIELIESEYNSKQLYNALTNYKKHKELIDEYEIKNNEYLQVKEYIDSSVDKIINLLIDEEFLTKSEENKYELTLKGMYAGQLKEVNCLVFSDLINNKKLQTLTSSQLVGVFSCFANITVSDNIRDTICNTDDQLLNTFINDMFKNCNDYINKEDKYKIINCQQNEMTFDLVKYSIMWCECDNENQCNELVRTMEFEKNIFLGEFVKALLKINNIVSEMEKICEISGDMEFLNKLSVIPELTLKYVVTNQSLYL